jgi:ketosteroid isomerase-like protein
MTFVHKRVKAVRPIARFALAALVAMPLMALAAGLPPDMAQAVKDYDHATIHSDVAALSRLFADDYVLVNSDASVENKGQAIADFLMPGFGIDPYTMEQTTEIVWNDAAVISGVVNLGWTQDGKHQSRLLRIAHVWARRNGRWQLTYTQVTRVPR